MEPLKRPLRDDELIAQLFSREEAVLERVAQQYGALYTRVLRMLLRDASDVEECGNDVLLALWNTIPPQRPRNLCAYLCTLARRIGIDRYRYNTREKRGDGAVVLLSELSDALPATSMDAEARAGELSALLSAFLDDLPTEERVLFVRRYVALEEVGELARRYHLRENAVSARLYRTRQKLKKFLEKEGYPL